MTTTYSSRLAQEVHTLLKNRPRSLTLAELHKRTGAPVWFMTRLACGHIHDGPASRLEHLYTVLSGKEIKFK